MKSLRLAWAGVVLCAVAQAQPPQPPATSPWQASEDSAAARRPAAAGSVPPRAAPPVAAPGDDFFEFLGADDVGDATWWEFLKGSAPRKDPPSAPPQDAAK